MIVRLAALLVLSFATVAAAQDVGPFVVGTTKCGTFGSSTVGGATVWLVSGCPALERCMAGGGPPRPTPVPTRTPAPTVAPQHCPPCAPGWSCDAARCAAPIFGDDCDCHLAPTRTPAPVVPTPSRTPAPTAAPTPVPPPAPSSSGASPAGRVRGSWWPTTSQVGLPQAFGSWPGSDHAAEEWWFCNPDQIDDATVRAAVEDRLAAIKAGAMPASKRPRCWVGESWTYGWCKDVAAPPYGGFRLKLSDGTIRHRTPAELPPALSSGGTTPAAIAGRVRNLLAWGVLPRDVATAPYAFTLMNQDGIGPMRIDFPTLFPTGYLPAKGATGMSGVGALDYPDAIVVRVVAACFSEWIAALAGQDPEIGLVVAQLSNGGGAFCYGGAGCSTVAAALARAESAAGYPRAIQIEAFACPSFPCTSGNWTASADCDALCAIEAAGATPSVFSGDLWASAAPTLEKCACR